MTFGYQTYPEYKDSGVEWLGVAPKHWNIIPVGRLFKRTKRTGHVDKELLSVYRDYGVIPKSSRDDNNNKPSEDLSPYQLVKENDLVMNKMKTWQGSIAISEYEGIVSPAYFVYEPLAKLFEVAYPKYIHYLLRNPMYIAQYLRRSKGIRVSQWDLDPDEFKRVELLLPAKPEQQKIADFLDHETAKIDTLIEKQQQLITLLKEKRQAVISHAVTKGLNPDAPMRDSGVEWLGEVPEHWDIKRFKNLFKIRKRISGELDHDVLSITQRGIKVKDIESGEGQLSMDYSKYQLVYKGDFAMNHMDLLTGFVDISKFDGVTSPDYRVFTLEANNSVPDYFLAFLQMGYINKLFFPFGQGAAHIGRWRLSTEAFNEFLAPCPAESEQKQIAGFISCNLKQMEGLEVKAKSAIELMKERRAALISAAVTGKIDVRHWQAPKPTANQPDDKTVAA